MKENIDFKKISGLNFEEISKSVFLICFYNHLCHFLSDLREYLLSFGLELASLNNKIQFLTKLKVKVVSSIKLLQLKQSEAIFQMLILFAFFGVRDKLI